MKYTKIPSDTFQNLQLNAGILVDSFEPSSGVIGNILGATTGGVNFTATPSFIDFGDDIDNCPKNTMELKKIESYDVSMSGTFVTVDVNNAKMLVGASEVDGIKVIPRADIDLTDFKEVWWIGDYSDENGDTAGGFVAIRLMNALNTGGFQIQSSDKSKGNFAFTFTGHYSIEAQDVVPFELYVKAGTPSSITLSNSTLSLTTGGSSSTLTATTVPADAVVTWASDKESIATVTSGGVVAPVAAGTANVTASITVDGKKKTATCVVTVVAGA